uniref:Uncharacterized protein n=1 Tax=Anguilla anguilla TaxID=7936 RepID=A0A0E9QHV3_ANGAN
MFFLPLLSDHNNNLITATGSPSPNLMTHKEKQTASKRN